MGKSKIRVEEDGWFTSFWGDVLVMFPLFCFCGRSEDGFGEFLRFEEALGETDSVGRSRFFVFCPS